MTGLELAEFFPESASTFGEIGERLQEAIVGRADWGFVPGRGLLYAPDGGESVVVSFFALDHRWIQWHFCEGRRTGGTAANPPSTSAPVSYQLDFIESMTRSARATHARNLERRAERS